MRSAYRILYFIGLIGIISSVPLRLLDKDAGKLLSIAGISFLFLAIVLIPFLPHKKNGYWGASPRTQKIWNTVGICGTSLFLLGLLLRLLHIPGGTYLTTAGSSIVLVFLLAILYYTVTSKYKTRGVPTTLETLNALGIPPADLYKFTGKYTNAAMPLIITITAVENTLIAQATGQPAFYLYTISSNEFKYEDGGIVIEFPTGTDELTLKQHGGFFPFIKEK